MKTIWLICSGEYSDYRVHCVCATEAIAQTVAQNMNARSRWYDEFDVTESTLLEDGDVLTPIMLHRAGWSPTAPPYDEPPHYGTELGGPWEKEGQDDFADWDVTTRNAYIQATSTRSKEAAIKAAQDARARLLAERAGVA